MTKSVGSRRGTRARCLIHDNLVPEMPLKSKTKDSNSKNKDTSSQTVLFSNFYPIPKVDATNARAKKAIKPASGTSTVIYKHPSKSGCI